MATSAIKGRRSSRGPGRAGGARSTKGLGVDLAGRLKPSPMPKAPAPMLCTLVAEPFDNPDWTFEPKFDGLRVLARFDGHSLTLMSRNGKEQSVQFPDVAAALRKSLTGPAIVDGEVVCFDDRGRSSFRALQQRFHLTRPAEIEARMAQYPASIYLFDILYVDRFDVTGLPLVERKELLRGAVRWDDRVRWTESTPEVGIKLWREACRNGDEGIVGKRLDSGYVPTRS
ncbi:MAG TPA: hypothetical protein VGZ22_07845, partial [Isosphaeraceae bacterium]|nr:hypothetical protein [Isosphaeraceae bacterium]